MVDFSIALPSLSVIMPAYNEQDAIEQAVSEIDKSVLSKMAGANLIVIDDGSRDETGIVLDRLAKANPRIHVIHQRNQGHGAAVRTGLEAARGEYIFLLDSDRQIPIEAASRLLQHAASHDAVLGVREARRDPVHRLVLSRVIRCALRFLFSSRLRDANAPFKIIQRQVWQEARDYIPEGTLAPSLFLALWIEANKRPFKEVEVPHRQRLTGEASIRHWKLFRFCVKGLRQLIAFRFNLKSPTA